MALTLCFKLTVFFTLILNNMDGDYVDNHHYIR